MRCVRDSAGCVGCTTPLTWSLAINRILDDAAREEPLGSMLVAEAELGKRLQHRDVVSVFDVDRDASGHPLDAGSSAWRSSRTC